MTLEHSFTRIEIVDRLRESMRAGKPIVGAGASCGLIAKAAELGGADLIIVYSTGKSRLMGLPTTPLGDANKVTLEMFDEIENVVRDTPIIGGALATDPTYMDLKKLLGKFRGAGYSGVINFPNVSTYGDERGARMDDAGMGISREFEMIRLAHEQDYFTMAYSYTSNQAKRMAAAGVDVQVAHVGWTVGGLVGRSAERAPSLDAAAEMVQTMIEITLQENPDCICLAHGGPYDTPENTQALYEQTDAKGFVGASSIERIPVERAVSGAVAAFKAMPMPRTQSVATPT